MRTVSLTGSPRHRRVLCLALLIPVVLALLIGVVNDRRSQRVQRAWALEHQRAHVEHDLRAWLKTWDKHLVRRAKTDKQRLRRKARALMRARN